MFKDRNKELQRLEQALLEEETEEFLEEEPADEDLLADDTLNELLDDEAPAEHSIPYQNYSNDYGQPCHAYNSDMAEEDMEEYCEEILSEEPKSSYTGLIILACLLATGILAMVIYLMLRYGGNL